MNKTDSSRYLYLIFELILFYLCFTSISQAQLLAAPSLVSPADNAADQPTTLTLKWNSVQTASSYSVQLALDSNFTDLVINQSGLTTTSYTAAGLSQNTKYYWRVSASTLLVLSSWSNVWRFTTSSPLPDPAVPALVSPADGSTNQPATITLSWNASANSNHYWIQIATDQSFSNPVIGDSTITGTTFQANNLAASTIFYWRVKGLSSSSASAWSNIWNFTTESSRIQPPSQPVLASPANGALNISTSVTLSWNPDSNADHYWIQVATDPNFSNMIFTDYTITGTSKQITGLSNSKTYYWQVRAINAGGQSPWSSQWSFSTLSLPVNPLAAPSLISPADSAVIKSDTVTFMWNQVANATEYHFQLSDSSSFKNLFLDDSNLTATNTRVNNLAPGKDYEWRVRAKNSGDSSTWSNPRQVKTASPTPSSTLAVPSLAAPPDGSANEPVSLTLKWYSAQGAGSYSLQVALDANFNNLVINQSGLQDTSYQVNNLLPGTVYYWRVGANTLLLFSGWSTAWNFSTVSNTVSLTAPALITPSNSSVNQPANIIFKWVSVKNALDYHFQLSLNQSFDSLITNDSTITDTLTQVNSLLHNKTYYWRVNAIAGQTTGPSSSVWAFTTGTDTNSSTLSAPVLLSPANASTNEPLYPILNWKKTGDAFSYHLQTATDQSFTNLVFDDSAVSATYYQVGKLSPGTKYYWRVIAHDSSGYSNWSSAWYFTTQQSTSDIPVPVSPVDGSKNQSLTVVCRWDSLPGAQMFDLQLSNAPGFDTLVIDDSTISATSAVIKNLFNSTTYFWRVRAKVDSAWQPFASAWSFSTIITQPTYSNLDTSLTFPEYSELSQYKSADYKLVGIPGAGNIPINAFLKGNPFSDWLAYLDNGLPDNYLVPYNSGGSFVFSTGTAFWILKKGYLVIDTTVENAPLNSNNEVEVPLHSGWNIITDPFTYPVEWDTIKAINNITEPAYSFNGSFGISLKISPYTGYYFFNADSLTTLKIPALIPVTAVQKTAPITSVASDPKLDWKLNIKLSSTNYTDSLAWIGVSSNVQDNFNKLDVHKPRSVGSTPTTCFFKPDWNEKYPVFASSIKPAFESFGEWHLTVNSKPGEHLMLSFNGMSKVPHQFEIYLLSSISNDRVDLRKSSSYYFTPVGQSTSFKILIGTDDALKTKLNNNSQPDNFSLGNNFPNPFNNSTVIPVYLPESENIMLDVFNIVGQKIKTIINERINKGRHYFRWDGTDDQGNVVSSGIYFYRLMGASNINMVKKMILLK